MTNFLIYPAVDIKDGKCVRLTHGKENHMTIYKDDPIKQVNFFSKNDLSFDFFSSIPQLIIIRSSMSLSIKSFTMHPADLIKTEPKKNKIK